MCTLPVTSAIDLWPLIYVATIWLSKALSQTNRIFFVEEDLYHHDFPNALINRICVMQWHHNNNLKTVYFIRQCIPTHIVLVLKIWLELALL